MSHASLKDQLQAVASQFSDPIEKDQKMNKKRFLTQKDKKPKPLWLDYVLYGIELLKVYYPLCFKSVAEVKPLKKGIKQDLIKHLSGIEDIAVADKACMVKSLAYYVNTAAYHKSVKANAVRIDLQGNDSGSVSPEEAHYSAERYQAKRQAKQAAVVPSATHSTEEVI